MPTHRKMIDEVMEVQDKLCNEWEVEFLRKISYQLKRQAPLTQKQAKILAELYDRACASPWQPWLT